jgi:membrane-bound metal-dependent hydrolase YbcI (DUF457 family)
MPNAQQHLVVGLAAGAITSALIQMSRQAADPSLRFDWGHLLLCAGAGGAAAMLPDLLEPAVHPWHRGFFHSVTAAFAVACLLSETRKHRLPKFTRMLLLAAAAGYGSHLAADALTPRSIPLI